MGVIPILLALAGVVIYGCSSDDGGGGNGTGDVDTDSDVDGDTDIDSDTDTDTVTDTETDTDTDECDDRPGINGSYYKCTLGSDPCSMLDVDIRGGIIKFMVDRPGNCLSRSTINEGDPMGYDAVVTANCAAEYGIGINTSDEIPVYPVQADLISAGDNIHAIQFRHLGTIYPDTDEEDSVDVSGLAFLNGVVDPNSDSEMIQGLDHILLPYDMYLAGVKSSALYETEEGSRLCTAATEPLTGNGIFLSYGFNLVQWLKQSDIEFPVFTHGKNPSAVAMVPDEVTDDETIAAVVNTEGGTKSWQLDGASIDFIDTLVSAAASSTTEAEGAIKAFIPFGAGVKLVPFPELPLTEDKSCGVVVGGAGDALTTLYVVDMEEKTFTSLDLSPYGNVVTGISLYGNTVAVSIYDTGHTEETTGGNVITVDIADPEAPFVAKEIYDVCYGPGALDMHETSGKVYIKMACQASFCEVKPTESDPPYETMVSIDPAEVE